MIGAGRKAGYPDLAELVGRDKACKDARYRPGVEGVSDINSPIGLIAPEKGAGKYGEPSSQRLDRLRRPRPPCPC